MSRVFAMIGGGALGVAVMLGILQPWKRASKAAPIARVHEPGGSVHTTIGDSRLSRAADLIESGQTEEAKRTLSEAIAADPNSAMAHALMALADIRNGDPKPAQESLAKAASIDPQLYEVALFQGHLDMLLRDHRAAVRSYGEAIKRGSGDGRALAGRAAARYEVKEFAGAIEDATAAISREPDALFTRAAAYAGLSRHEESVRDWTAYLARKPKDAHAWMNRGNAHERLGRTAAAVADWKEAVRLDSRLAEQLDPLINR